jgi:hypothetical protein
LGNFRLLQKLEEAERKQRGFLLNDEIKKKNDYKLWTTSNKGSTAWKIFKENMAQPDECYEVS